MLQYPLPARENFRSSQRNAVVTLNGYARRQSFYGRGLGVGRALGVGAILGVGVGLGVAVGVAVAAAVGVAVGVGVGVGVAPDWAQYLAPLFR